MDFWRAGDGGTVADPALQGGLHHLWPAVLTDRVNQNIEGHTDRRKGQMEGIQVERQKSGHLKRQVRREAGQADG